MNGRAVRVWRKVFDIRRIVSLALLRLLLITAPIFFSTTRLGKKYSNKFEVELEHGFFRQVIGFQPVVFE
jgi:hypothetical protein